MARILAVFALLLAAGCTVQDRQKFAVRQTLEHIDDPETGVRCYYISGLNSIDCVQLREVSR